MATIDNTNPLGPCIVAASTVSDPQKIALKSVLNGDVVQDGSTAYVSSISLYSLLTYTRRDQIFNVAQTIAHLSQGTTLLPGSLILTGTPKGVGFVKKPAVYLKHGDKLDVWVGNGVGTLVNWVVEEGVGEKAKL